MLQIVKLTGKLSHEVRLENVSWCNNDLANTNNLYPTDESCSPLQVVQTKSPELGRARINLHNVLIHQNYYFDDSQEPIKNSNSLMSFTNIEITMTGSNCFADNGGGLAIYVISSNLTVTGNLTIEDGNAIEGGAIHLDSTSTLFLTEPLSARFSNNMADEGSAIYAPVNEKRVSAIQLWPRKRYSLSNVTSIDISLYFHNNSNSEIARSFYAPHFSFFGSQLSPNLLFTSDTWDHQRSQYAYTTLIDAVLHMEERDKFTSLSNGLCIQIYWLEWHCDYIDGIISRPSAQTSDDSRIKIYSGQKVSYYYILYSMEIYPGQKAFSVQYVFGSEVYDIGSFYSMQQGTKSVTVIKPYKNYTSSLLRENSTLSFTLHYSPSEDLAGNSYIALFTDVEVGVLSVPILLMNMTKCPLGFQLFNGICDCETELKKNNYVCKIDSQSFSSELKYWTGFEEDHAGCPRVLFDNSCPPSYCDMPHDFHVNDDLALACRGNRTGILCGECKENYSVVFGNNTCYHDCTDVYLLTLPVYALAGLLLVLVLFVLRVTVATGTINGVIFYANILGLVMDKLTEDMSGHYVMFVRVFFSLLNLDLGFPLCLYEGMTTAGKVGFQFVFPVYLWSIVVALILISHFSIRVSNLISNSSVQVLATLFYLCFSKLLRTVIVIFSPSLLHMIGDCGNNTANSKLVWYFNGQDYGHGTHAILLTLALVFTVLFLLPYALLVTFSPCLVRFRVVNKFRPFFDAYGGPFKDKWRFWFGLRLWITILLFSLDGALEGTDYTNTMFIIHVIVIMVLIELQGLVRPFKKTFIGILDFFFMANYWLLVSSTFWTIFAAIYFFLTATAVFVVCLVILLHICTLKYRDNCPDVLHRVMRVHKRRGYEVIENDSAMTSNADIDLFRAAEQRSQLPVRN